MKLVRMLAAAGLVISTLGVPAVASAQDHGRRYEHRDDRGRDARGPGYHRGDRRHDSRRGWRNGRHHPRCHMEWRHHRKVRVCR
jgi:hypothetical protein